MDRFIVAEITKTWKRATPVDNLICQQFEMVINTNLQRGYKLADWRLCAVSNITTVTETIVAIFERVDS